MTVRKSDYRRKAKHHKVMVNIRLRCISPGRRPTRKQIEEVLLQILDQNTVPLGWEVAFVEWGNPKGASIRWKTSANGGDLGDIQEFHSVIASQLKKMRIGVVRNERLTGEEL
jgi:hypothetical protein